MKMKKKLLFVLAMLSCLVSFAKSRYVVEVNSFGEYDMNGKTFIIIPADEGVNKTDLEFKEYSGYICKVLATAGAREVEDVNNADICILMHYEITDKSYNETVAVPIIGKTGINSITTNTNSSGNTNTFANVNVSAYGNGAYGSGNSNKQTNKNTTSTTNVNYSYGITGYNNVEKHVEKFLRVINLYAYENKNLTTPNMLWKSNIMSEGWNNDLRTIFPYMSYIAMNGVNKNEHNTYSIETPHSSFDVFQNMKIRGDNTYPAPIVDMYSNEDIKIASIERKPNETIITFFKPKDTKSISISENIILEYDGNIIKPLDATNIKLGKKIKKDSNMLFSISFPAIPKDVRLINISEEKDDKIKDPRDKKYWKGIHLEK